MKASTVLTYCVGRRWQHLTVSWVEEGTCLVKELQFSSMCVTSLEKVPRRGQPHHDCKGSTQSMGPGKTLQPLHTTPVDCRPHRYGSIRSPDTASNEPTWWTLNAICHLLVQLSCIALTRSSFHRPRTRDTRLENSFKSKPVTRRS
jgi:hypothetical protein